MGSISSTGKEFDPDHHHIFKSGYLEKESKWNKKWRRRYTILTKCNKMHTINIYTFEDNDTSKPPTEAIIDVKNYHISHHAQYFWLHKKYDLNKSFRFKCKNTNEVNEWIQAIHKHKNEYDKKTKRNQENVVATKSVKNTPELKVPEPAVEDAVKNDFDSDLFKNIDINTLIPHRKCQKSEKKCLSIQRMKTLLCALTPSNNIMDIYENAIVNYYNVTAVLNDYIHITNHHDDMLEDILEELQLTCDLEACNSICRNNSDKNKHMITNTIICLFDQIHQYVLHTFDTGYRLLGAELSLIDRQKKNDKEHTDTHYLFHHMRKILHNKRARFRKYVSNNRINEHQKFVTVINEQTGYMNGDELFMDVFYSSLTERNFDANLLHNLHQFFIQCEYDSDAIQFDLFENISETETDFKESNICKFITEQKHLDELLYEVFETVKSILDENITVYCFSHRFYYWKYYKNKHSEDYQNPGYKCSELYISNKHTTFKEELLHNEVCKINQIEWQEINAKAQYFIETAHVKQLKVSHGYERESGLKNKSPILLNHLISAIAYCDFDKLSYNFSSTFRYSSKINTLNKLKKYHSNYYWFAKYLRELVALFGDTLSMRACKISELYHGISKKMLFQSTVAAFCHPTSTTKRKEVAQLFATTEGIIVQLHAANFSLPYFSCSFISKFAAEEECLFIGGYNRLKIIDIIDCENDLHYSKYLKVLSAFTTQMQAGVYDKWQADDSLLQQLIENNSNKIPQYISNIFHKWKINTELISLDIKAIAEYGGKYLPLLLLTSPNDIYNSFIKLKVICQMFPNCKKIIIQSDYGLNLTVNEAYLLLILSQLQKMNYISHKLEVILFENGIDVDFNALESLKHKYIKQKFNIKAIDDQYNTAAKKLQISTLLFKVVQHQ